MSGFEVAPAVRLSGSRVSHVCFLMTCQVTELYNDSILLTGVWECPGHLCQYVEACTLIRVHGSRHGVHSFCKHMQCSHHLLSCLGTSPGCSAHYHFLDTLRVDCAHMWVPTASHAWGGFCVCSAFLLHCTHVMIAVDCMLFSTWLAETVWGLFCLRAWCVCLCWRQCTHVFVCVPV